MTALTSKTLPADTGEVVYGSAELEAEGAITSFQIEAFEAKGRHYLLKDPTECHLSIQQGYYIFECPAYHVDGYAKDRNEAFVELNVDFACRYDGLVNEPDDSLTLDAIRLRDIFREGVLQVDAAGATIPA